MLNHDDNGIPEKNRWSMERNSAIFERDNIKGRVNNCLRLSNKYVDKINITLAIGIIIKTFINV